MLVQADSLAAESYQCVRRKREQDVSLYVKVLGSNLRRTGNPDRGSSDLSAVSQ